MNVRTLATVAVVLAAIACTAQTARAQPTMQPMGEREQLAVGAWYGEYSQPPHRVVQKFITTRGADGTFAIHARLYEAGRRIGELHNSGLWGLSNGMYFTVTTEIDGRRTDARGTDVINAYLVQRLEGDEFEYVHVASGNRFKVRRVQPGSARLPD
jgi:hypothetical protein